jgi:transposase InsO family protein
MVSNQPTQALAGGAPRTRDACYGNLFVRRVRSLGICDRPTPRSSPWQNGYAERPIGSICPECLDHVVVFSERHMQHLLLSYMDYYNTVRTHLSLADVLRPGFETLGWGYSGSQF